jgi:diacylglycerol kinase (ATP)
VRYVLIVNPVAGGGRGKRVLGEALETFREAGIVPPGYITAAHGEARDIAAGVARSGADVIVALGGDGHAAAVGEALVGTGVALAVLPAGSANDYARSLRMPRRNVRGAVATIIRGEIRLVDTIRVRNSGAERHFLNVVGTGFDAAVAERAERIPYLRGTGRYVVALARELPRFQAAEIELTIDGERHAQRAMMVAIANGHSYGGGMRIAPEASLDSGWLEVCIVGDVSKAEFVRAFPRVFRGTHVSHPRVTMLRGREVTVAADRPLTLMADGENVGQLPAHVSVAGKALAVVVGPSSEPTSRATPAT